MHNSAQEFARSFFDNYAKFLNEGYSVVEFGSKDNSQIKEICGTSNYTGLDLEEGYNVDVVLKDPYEIPLDDNSADILVSSSCFEHVPLFWLSFLEGMRILKPNGLFYINAPSQGPIHNFPVDCWRFYPDSGDALVSWANRNGYNSKLLQCFVTENDSTWKDCVIVVLKDEKYLDKFPKRM